MTNSEKSRLKAQITYLLVGIIITGIIVIRGYYQQVSAGRMIFRELGCLFMIAMSTYKITEYRRELKKEKASMKE